jgi:N-acetylmuramic acid 6-phosphate etherase
LPPELPREPELAGLTTEQVDPRYARIDVASVGELAVLMNDADAEVPSAVRTALPQIVPAIEAVVARVRSGGRLLYVGAGTPGRIGVLDAAECPPTFGTPPELVRAIVAGGLPLCSPRRRASRTTLTRAARPSPPRR